MTQRWTGLGLTLAVAAGAACGGGEDAVIESYFAALSAGDRRGLESVSVATFSEEVEAWTRTGESPETSAPVTLPDLTKRYEEAAAALEEHKKKSSQFALDHLSDVNKVQGLLESGEEIPEELQETADTWQELSDEEAALKESLAEAQAAMESERRVTALSAGEASDLGTAGGEVKTKQVELSLTIGGEAKPYVMTLRRYMLDKSDTPREISRWVVYDLKPKS